MDNPIKKDVTIGDCRLILGDCIEVMPLLGKVNCVIADPPYCGIKEDDWDNQWESMSEFQGWVRCLASIVDNIMNDNSSLYWFGDDKNIAYCQVALDEDFRLLNSLVWRKVGYHTMKGAETAFRSYAPITERCLFYDKGESKTGLQAIEKEYIAPRNPFAKELKRARLEKGVSINQVAEYGKFYGTVNHGGAVTNWEKGYNVPLEDQWRILCDNLPIVRVEYEGLRREYEGLRREYEGLRRVWNNNKYAFDVLDFKVCRNQQHPTQKPLDLIEFLMMRSTRQAETILDPFMGSGTTLVACAKLGRKGIGIELDPEYFEIACKRVQEAYNQPDLFVEQPNPQPVQEGFDLG